MRGARLIGIVNRQGILLRTSAQNRAGIGCPAGVLFPKQTPEFTAEFSLAIQRAFDQAEPSRVVSPAGRCDIAPMINAEGLVDELVLIWQPTA